MLKICIISTYRGGTRNIGDYLITASLRNLIEDIVQDCHVKILFRGDEWGNVERYIKESDFVFFACLAIRKNIDKYYPFVDKVIESGVRYAVVSSGTSLPVHSQSMSYSSALTPSDLSLIKALSSKAEFFTTRDYLTHSFLCFHDVPNATYGGDVAFYKCGKLITQEYSESFEVDLKGKSNIKIAVSDPHYAPSYKESFFTLLEELKRIFGDEASITLVLHGSNDEAISLANEYGIEYVEIWKDKDNGLDYYDNVDLHVGYRVHGHVTCLSKGVPSYLLAQDGRGAGYGITMQANICVNNFRAAGGKKLQASASSVYILSSMIENDLNENFVKFGVVMKQIADLVNNLRDLIKRKLL